MPAAARAHHQLGFGSGGYTGTAGTKPFRFGISTFAPEEAPSPLGRLWSQGPGFLPGSDADV